LKIDPIKEEIEFQKYWSLVLSSEAPFGGFKGGQIPTQDFSGGPKLPPQKALCRP